jgi:hypothetical protein
VQNLIVLNNSDQLFAAKYLTYMPTQEELRREIEQQKEFFRLQNEKYKCIIGREIKKVSPWYAAFRLVIYA